MEREKIIQLLMKYRHFKGYDEDNHKCYGGIPKSNFEAIATELSEVKEPAVTDESLRENLELFIQWLQDTYRGYGAIDSSFDGNEAFKFFVPNDEDIDEYLKSGSRLQPAQITDEDRVRETMNRNHEDDADL